MPTLGWNSVFQDVTLVRGPRGRGYVGSILTPTLLISGGHAAHKRDSSGALCWAGHCDRPVLGPPSLFSLVRPVRLSGSCLCPSNTAKPQGSAFPRVSPAPPCHKHRCAQGTGCSVHIPLWDPRASWRHHHTSPLSCQCVPPASLSSRPLFSPTISKEDHTSLQISRPTSGDRIRSLPNLAE